MSNQRFYLIPPFENGEGWGTRRVCSYELQSSRRCLKISLSPLEIAAPSKLKGLRFTTKLSPGAVEMLWIVEESPRSNMLASTRFAVISLFVYFTARLLTYDFLNVSRFWNIHSCRLQHVGKMAEFESPPTRS